MDFIGAWDETEAQKIKEANTYDNFMYDNSTNGGIIDNLEKYYETIKKVEESSNLVISNLNDIKNKYDAFNNVLTTLGQLSNSIKSNISALKRANENIVRNLEKAVMSEMEKDARYGEDLDLLTDLMNEEGLVSNRTIGIGSESVPNSAADINANSSNINYTIKQGDTLSSIARENGTTVDELVEANGISNPNLIVTGQELVIPQKVENNVSQDTGTISTTTSNSSSGNNTLHENIPIEEVAIQENTEVKNNATQTITDVSEETIYKANNILNGVHLAGIAGEAVKTGLNIAPPNPVINNLNPQLQPLTGNLQVDFPVLRPTTTPNNNLLFSPENGFINYEGKQPIFYPSLIEGSNWKLENFPVNQQTTNQYIISPEDWFNVNNTNK